MTQDNLPTRTPADVRAALLAREEIALLDVREEDPYAQAHPLWAANFSASRLEIEAWGRLPRRTVPIVVYDDGEGLAEPAARRLRALGYEHVSLLAGGLQAWRDAGYELFRDVNVPSKSFGELVESRCHTPSFSAPEVQALLEARANVVVLDARRYDEYHTMSIPGGVSVPGGELVRRVRDLAPDPATQVIVNCAGRTRSIIGTQSLINAGIPNPVAALRNGTIGWTLAGQQLAHGQQRRHEEVPAGDLTAAREAAADVARRAGARRIDEAQLRDWVADVQRTTYRFDVRGADEYARGHRPGFRHAPGGQLVQETDHQAPVRGARIVLTDDDGVRAHMAASWLAQMGWEVAVLPHEAAAYTETGPDRAPQPTPPEVASVLPADLARWQQELGDDLAVVNLTASANHVAGHIPGAWWTTRARLASLLATTLAAQKRVVLTCGSSLLARFAAGDVAQALAAQGRELYVLEGGNAAWAAAGLPQSKGEERLAAPRDDRYRRPYEGTDNPRSAMQAYLDWEFGLIAQLERDGTHFFKVLTPV